MFLLDRSFDPDPEWYKRKKHIGGMLDSEYPLYFTKVVQSNVLVAARKALFHQSMSSISYFIIQPSLVDRKKKVSPGGALSTFFQMRTMASFWMFIGHVPLGETAGQIQNSLKGLNILPGLGTAWDLPGGAADCHWGERCLGFFLLNLLFLQLDL